MASSYDWSTYDPSKLYGKYTQYVGDTKADRDATYVGLKPEYTQGFNWQDPNSTVTLGDKSFKNPYQYGSASTGYAGLNGLQDSEGWRTYGSGDSEYKAYVDNQQNGGIIGQAGPDGIEGNAYLSAPSGTRYYGNIMQSDPRLAAKLKEYVFEDPEHGLLVPEDAYKNWTHELGYWRNAPGFMTLKGLLGDTAFPVIAAALGGMAAEAAGLLGTGAAAGGSGAGLGGGAGGLAAEAGTGLSGWGSGLSAAAGYGPGSAFGGLGATLGEAAGLGSAVGPTLGSALSSAAGFGPSLGAAGVFGSGMTSQSILDQVVGYIQNQYGTPEGLAKQAASQILKSLLGGSSSNIDGSGDSIFGPLDSTNTSGSIFDNSSIFGGGGGGGMSLVDDGSFLTDFLKKNGLQALLSLGSGALGSNAANQASQAQQQAAAQAIAEQRRQYDLTRADNAPFRDTGVAGNLRLRQLLGLEPTYTGADSGSLVKKFTQGDLEADPVYQNGLKFGLDEGRKAIDNRAAASGMWDSGATLKALTRYGTDYGSTKANDSYNRYNTTNDSIFNKLAGISGAGQTATNTVTAAGTNMANNVANTTESIGNSRAASVVGGANAWSQAMGGIGNAIGNSMKSDQTAAILRALGIA